MRGAIYTKEKCPMCGGRFIQNEDLLCPAHQTKPRRFYIHVYSTEFHKHINIHSNSRGEPFSSYEQAERILNKMRAEIDEGKFEASRYMAQTLQTLRFLNWAESWFQRLRIEVEKGIKAPSYLKMVKVHLRYLKTYYGRTDLRDVRARQVEEFYLSLDGSPKYRKNILTTFHAMLSDACRWGDIGAIPQFPEFEVPEVELRTIDLDTQDAVINAIGDPMDRAYILFTAREMLRPSETRALQWADLDFKHDRVTIRRHFSLNEIKPATKARQIKVLPLDGEVKTTLQALPRHISSPFVFWRGKDGSAYSESWARKIWREACGKIGVDISLYQGTRHSSATEAADRVGVDATQEFLHHTNRKMTERYVKQNPDRLKKVLRSRDRPETVIPLKE